jgi:cytochrome c553
MSLSVSLSVSIRAKVKIDAFEVDVLAGHCMKKLLLASVLCLALVACRGGNVGTETVDRCVPEGSCDEAMFANGLHSVPPNLEIGSTLFTQVCGSCHGPGGEGLAETKRVNFTDPVWHAGKKDRDIASAITQGRPPRMPAMPMAESQLRDLVGYIRSLKSGEAPPVEPTEKAGY